MADFTKPKIIIDLEEYEHLKKIEKEYNATAPGFWADFKFVKRDIGKESDELFHMVQTENAQP